MCCTGHDVNHCSAGTVDQWEAVPEGVPLAEILAGTENCRPARGERASVEAEQAVSDQVRIALQCQLSNLDDTGDGVALAKLLGQRHS